MPRVSAAASRISNDRGSGERRCARLEWRALRRDKNEREAIKMRDCLRNGRQRQLRRVRQKRISGEMYDRADRAIIVRICCRMLRRRLLGCRRRIGERHHWRRAVTKAVEVNVPER